MRPEKMDKKKPLGMRIGESVFSAGYLTFALVAGGIFLSRCIHSEYYLRLSDDIYLFAALMTFTLAIGDAFHLIPRIMINIYGPREKDAFLLGLGNLISSITMTIFYLLFYFVIYYSIYPVFRSMVGPWLVDNFRRITFQLLFCLALIRIALCLFPQNKWFHREGNQRWAILRNIPFMLMGVVTIVYLLITYVKVHNREIWFSFLPAGHYVLFAVLVALSFLFYILVVLFAKKKPKMGMLMIPKTICYILLIRFLL